MKRFLPFFLLPQLVACDVGGKLDTGAIPIDTGDLDVDGDGYTAAQGDCDPADGAIHPDADEICDGVDNNCDGDIDGDTCCDAGYSGDPCTDIDECTEGLDNCAENATCLNTEGSFTCTCPPGYEGDGTTCTEVAASLDGLRWEMPCGSSYSTSTCNAAVDWFEESTALAGLEGTTYEITLWLRGVVEEQSYARGTQDGYWYAGGASADANYNIYALAVSDPAQTYFLNAGVAGKDYCVELDYQVTVEMNAGATITMTADAQDGRLIKNRDTGGRAIIPAYEDLDPWPASFDGQFVQMDVVAVVAR